MPKFLTIGYGDEAGYERTPSEIRKNAHEHETQMINAGAIVGVAAFPVQVRNALNQGLQVNKGAYLRSDLPLAGFALIEADSLEAAIKQVAQTPCAVAYGVVEIWPLESTP